MAKGKKTMIKEIKRVGENQLLINGNVYVILQDIADIETAETMKISSHGNRILRFEDDNKKARIDVLRELQIVKYTINDDERAAKFKKGYDRTLLQEEDKHEIIAKADCHTHAREIVDAFTTKEGKHYDKKSGIHTFYISEEV